MPILPEVERLDPPWCGAPRALRVDDGAPLPVDLEISLATGEAVTAERADRLHWWAKAGVHEVRLIRAGIEGEQAALVGRGVLRGLPDPAPGLRG